MHSKFHEMLMKKRDMKPSEKHAKLGVLKDLKDSLADSMGDKLDGMKKVSVISNSPQGLSAGLDKAKQIAQNPDLDQDGMADGGMVMGSDPNESDHGDMPMRPEAKSISNPDEPDEVEYSGEGSPKHSDSDEPEHVKYMSEGGEVDASDVTYSGEPHDDGFMHPDSDEAIHGESYSEGGRVKSPLDQAADEADEERAETMSDQGEDIHPEFKGLNLQEVQEKLNHLMKIKKQMEQQ